MEEKILSGTPLFQGCTGEEIRQMLRCLNARVKSFKRDERILEAGQIVTAVGVVLEGSVLIESNDVWGNRSVLDKAGPGEIFAETYACIPEERLMVDVVAAEAVKILFLDIKSMLTFCKKTCSCHGMLVRNLLQISAQKNLNLSRRIFFTASKSIRGRLLSYLSSQAQKHGSRDFTIPFNRQQLADYLGVDRSALSAELGRMRQDGLLLTERNHFQLLTEEET